MSKVIQRNFAAGEITPDLDSRSDFVSYKNGLSTLRNAYVKRQGSLSERPGTQFIAEVKDSTKKTRLLEFEFSNEDSFIIEMGDQYMRFHRLGSTVLTEPFVPTIPSALNPTIFLGDHAYSGGDEVVLTARFFDGSGNPQGKIVNKNFIVTFTDGDNIRLSDKDGNPLDTSTFGTQNAGLSSISRIYEVDSPFTEDEIFDVRYSQSADFLTLTHFDKGVFNLVRVQDDQWSIDQDFFEPSVDSPDLTITKAPDPPVNPDTFSYRYYVTAIDAETGQESLAESVQITNVDELEPGTDGTLLNASYVNVVAEFELNAQNLGKTIDSFNFYREEIFPGDIPDLHNYTSGGFLTNKKALLIPGSPDRYNASFFDLGVIIPDLATKPPEPSTIYGDVIGRDFYANGAGSFDLTNLHPTAVSTSKQRRFYGGSNLKPETNYGSRVSRFSDFTKRSFANSSATDPVEFQTTSEKLGKVQHLVDYKRLMIFTETAEFIAQGGESGQISAVGLPNTEKISEDGTNNLRPIIADKNVLYVQARGSQVKFVGGQITIDDYRGNELSILSSHLVEEFQLVDWTYQQVPHGVVWAVRNDGVFLSLTYNPEQSINGWARHDFLNGKAESIANVPEGDVDKTYIIVNRTINGRPVKSIEAFDLKVVNELEDMKLMDSHLSFDGTNTDLGHSITASAADFTYGNDITLTSSQSDYFSLSNDRVGQSIFLRVEGEEIRFDILERLTDSTARTRANKDVPAGFQAVAITDWSLGIKEVGGLYHLEGESLSVISDGFVSANPLNNNYALKTVTDGSITLDFAAKKISAGLPMIVDIETLDIDGDGPTNSLQDTRMAPQHVNLKVRRTATFFAGQKQPEGNDVTGLREAKIRNFENYNEPNALKDGIVDVNFESRYRNGGRVFIRQIDPLPLRILSIGIDGNF